MTMEMLARQMEQERGLRQIEQELRLFENPCAEISLETFADLISHSPHNDPIEKIKRESNKY